MENTINPKDVKGWGIDADPKNEPTYPMKKWTGDDHKRSNWERPPLQENTHQEFHSNERPGMSAVFGTSVPPSGLSGMLRKKAFKYSENHYGHWLTLMAADRVNMVEGIIADIAKGHFPNIFAERGWKAEWKYNRKELTTKIVVATAVAVALVLLVKRKKRKHALS